MYTSQEFALVAHYEAGDDAGLGHQVRSVYHFLGKLNDQQPMQLEVLRFFRRLGHFEPARLCEEFQKLKVKLEEIAAQPFDHLPILCCDIISWLESKVSGRSVQEVMQAKFLTLK